MSWKAEYIILILISTLVDYWAGLKMGMQNDQRKRKKYLIISIIMNLGILFSFKYYNFFSDTINSLLRAQKVLYDVPTLDLLLPVGISFYTFQTLSYSIDVYRGNIKPERHLGKFALYVAYFPQLVAGPIERPSHLLPQLSKQFVFEKEKAVSGLKLMLWGLFKKVCIADRLAEFVNVVYNEPGSYYGLTLVIATLFFAFQIYCDFSGYSDIAIGAARMMGIDLMKNFRTPYFSKSISEFWRRWHISLSFWFRDYVYIPLGGNKVKISRWYINIFITFLLSGLWHGANWTFVAWGALHGLFIIIGHAKSAFLNMDKWRFTHYRWFNYFSVLSTFLLVQIGWVFFRANNIQDAFTVFGNMLQYSGNLIDSIVVDEFDFYISWLLILFLLVAEYFHEKYNIVVYIRRFPSIARLGIYSFFLMIILALGVFFENQDFIYFQF